MEESIENEFKDKSNNIKNKIKYISNDFDEK